ncbi:MAG: linear amide C-N hydrolase [Candidatus Saccharicenans sp.]|nr:linear amide C-N hydrolase [Candidatus Saccharicenans sp.]
MTDIQLLRNRVFILIFIGLLLIAARAEPCSTFLLKKNGILLVGHNLDERAHVPGLVIINKRGIAKTSVSWASLISGKPDSTPPLTWKSKYASITFNAFGRDFPDDGINEKGLFIGEMTLQESRFPDNPALPRIFMSLWMQYVLDSFDDIDQVIESASRLTIDGWGWHFFTADSSGRAAAIEFLDGRVVVNQGENMPVPVLCNSQYEEELGNLSLYQSFGGNKPVSMDKQETPRFVQAAWMLENFSPDKKEPVDYAFEILSQLERGGTQWSLVCDLKKQRVWFRSAASPKIKEICLKAFNPECTEPVKFVDIHSDLEGDVSKDMDDYSYTANRSFCEKAMKALLKISPLFEKVVAMQGGTMDGLLERIATFPEKAICQHP